MLARPDNLHSRLVYWLKIVLPLMALALLSTLFLLSRDIRPEDAIPYAEADLQDLMQNPRLTAPDFSGVTEDGAALSLKAAEVQLDNAESAVPGEVRLLYGSVATPDGGKTEFSAGQAHLDTAAQILSLGDGVKLTNSLGYQIATQGLSVALDRTQLTSDGPITAEAPAFTLSAGGMELRLADPEGPSYLLVFKSGVRMVYRPGIQGSDE